MIAIYTPNSTAVRRVWRDSTYITPYQAGFEDSRYNKIYRNPFAMASDAWRDYDAGHEDARRNKESRI